MDSSLLDHSLRRPRVQKNWPHLRYLGRDCAVQASIRINFRACSLAFRRLDDASYSDFHALRRSGPDVDIVAMDGRFYIIISCFRHSVSFALGRETYLVGDEGGQDAIAQKGHGASNFS